MNFTDLPNDIQYSIFNFLTVSDALPACKEWPLEYCIPCKHGLIIETHKSSGKISELDYWKNNMRHGPSISYYESGVMANRSMWVLGKLHGLWEEWDEESNIVEESHFKNGILEWRNKF